MTNQTYIYRLPSGDASLIEPISASGFFELSASSFSKNHLLKALAEALTLLHRLNQPVLESQQQPAATVPAVAAVEAHSEFTVFCPGCGHDQATAHKAPEDELFIVNCPRCSLEIERDALELNINFSPEEEFHNLIGFFKMLGNLANRDEAWQRKFYANLLSKPKTPLRHIFDTSFFLALDAYYQTLEQLAPVAKAGESC